MIYMSAVRAMNQEAIDVCGQPSVHPSELKCHWRSAGLESKPTKLQEKLSVQSFSTKAPAIKGWRLLFAVDIHFHSTESYPIPCNLGELKWGLGKCIRWFTPISCIWTDLSIDKSWSLLNSCASSCAHISYLCWQSLNINPYKQRLLFYVLAEVLSQNQL